MDKSPDAFRTISEVAESLDTPAHVLRFWESRFPQIKPVKRAGGRRYYRPADVALLTGIKRLLHDEGLTIRGVQKILRDQGVRHVAGLTGDSAGFDQDTADQMLPEDATVDDVPEAGFIAIDDPDPEPVTPSLRDPAPARQPMAQSELPLFDVPPALARSDLPPRPAPMTGRKPTLRDDTTFVSLIRGLRLKSETVDQAQLAEVVRRLTALRDRMAERAAVGIG
ncbi:MAG TPA: MerR family transcriptional regulator [Tabrizicola sp.]|nr:MerR family transcriptional regulator [Tabrizicola sp.]